MKRTDCTAHGFRSSFRVWSAKCTPYSQEECEAALALTLKERDEAFLAELQDGIYLVGEVL